jgi:hypothetical protein
MYSTLTGSNKMRLYDIEKALSINAEDLMHVTQEETDKLIRLLTERMLLLEYQVEAYGIIAASGVSL